MTTLGGGFASFTLANVRKKIPKGRAGSALHERLEGIAIAASQCLAAL